LERELNSGEKGRKEMGSKTGSFEMEKRIALGTLIVIVAITTQSQAALAGEKYPLTMTAVYTEGHNLPNKLPKHDFTSGDYECTAGDENHAPECHTIQEWADLDRMSGTPTTVLFTMADGVQIGVQERSVNKVYDTACDPGVSIIFCDIYFKLLGMTEISPLRQGQFGQDVDLTADEYKAALDALHQKLFGNGNQMQVTVHYRLKGKPDKSGFQRIEVEGIDSSTTHILNPLGDGYYVKNDSKP
jgi:hypothetical protein